MLNKKHNPRKGFTIIELLVVIMIIGLLAVTGFANYSQTKKSAELALQTDTLVSKLRSAKMISQNTATPECIGFYFKQGTPIQEVHFPYQDRFTPCKSTPDSTITSNPLDSELVVTNIQHQSTEQENFPLDQFLIVYYPPKGYFSVYNTNINNPSFTSDNLLDFKKLQIDSRYKDQDNTKFITIFNSGIIQAESKTDSYSQSSQTQEIPSF